MLRPRHYFGARTGYILQEVILGVVVFGIAIVPVLRGISRLPQIGAKLGEQGRIEAWRSAVDQVAGAGIDPVATPVLGTFMPGDALKDFAPNVTRAALPADAAIHYGTVVSGLYDSFHSAAESRVVGAGFEVGGNNSPAPARRDPLLPLSPRTLPPPVISNPLSPLVSLAELVPQSDPAAPYTARIQATGTDRVRLRQVSPDMRESVGTGAADLIVTATDLARSVRGDAWSEYAGTEGVDTSIALPDLRVRWIVRVGRQVQVIEPSERVPFMFGVDIGRPAYRVGTDTYASGAQVPIDLPIASAIERGTTTALITYPDAVRAVFGDEWAAVAPSFQWSFGGYPGDSSGGNTLTVFGAPFRPLWQDSQMLHAAPQSPLSGLPLYAGSWTVVRRSIVLAPPERVPSYYEGLTDAPGLVDFKAPILPAVGVRVGRPEIGSVQSIGGTLSVQIVP